MPVALSFTCCKAATLAGRTPYLNMPTCCSLALTHFTNSQAASWFFEYLLMPRPWQTPVVLGDFAPAGSGATLKLSMILDCLGSLKAPGPQSLFMAAWPEANVAEF